jgi:citrate synthase
MNASVISETPFVPGLEGVVAVETALSHVDGRAGRLILCGEALADFVARHDFESAAAAFWAAAQGTPSESPETVRAWLGRARETAFARFERLAPALEGLALGDALRVGIAAMSDDDPAPHVAVTGAWPVLVANLARRERGLAPEPPDLAAGHVEDFLRMRDGAAPETGAVEALTTYLTTVMDHGMNASTFTARVIASTRAGLVGGVTGAYAALTGPLHGGAPEPVLDMLDAIGRPECSAEWIEAELERGERLMGFGHRVYRVRDPRADVLAAAFERLGKAGPRLELARAVERAALEALARAKPNRRIETNVEFYTAMLLDALGMPRSLFTPLFAMGRVVGWTAHAIEQRRTGRLIRPDSRYVGRAPQPG